MRLGSRLLLPLLAVVTLVMVLAGAWALAQRTRVLVAETRRETRAFAVALGLSMEQAFRDPDLTDVQQMIDRLGREPMIYGIVVYGRRGQVLFVSDSLQGQRIAPPPQLRGVLSTRQMASVDRRLGARDVYSVISPVAGPHGEVVGAFEVAQPLHVIEAEKARVRHRFLVSTLALLGAVTAVILLLVRGLVGRPLERLVAAVRALGRGEMTYRVSGTGGGGELAELAREFNRMADHLEAARNDLVRETEERLSLEVKMRRTEKLAAVGQLAAGLAHEIGAPLHVIRGRAEMLLKREPSAEVRERNLRIIVDQISRITLVVQNLLDFSRRSESQIQPTEVGRVIHGVTELLEAEFARNRVEVVHEGGGPAWIEGNPHLLHQVFLNLFVNAIHAMEAAPGARRLTIRTVRPPEPPDGAGSVVVEVEDTGPGIADEALPHIFEPFFTTKTGGQGTGLGLAVVRGIMEEHGGGVEAERVPGGGAIFRLTFRLEAREAAHV